MNIDPQEELHLNNCTVSSGQCILDWVLMTLLNLSIKQETLKKIVPSLSLNSYPSFPCTFHSKLELLKIKILMNKFMKCLKFLMLIETKQSILKTFKWGSKKWMLKCPKMICSKCSKLQEKVNSVLNNSDNLFSINEGFYLIKLLYFYLFFCYVNIYYW